MTLVSFFEKAFNVLLRLPELWLETWWRILRRPLKTPLMLALLTRRSFDVALPGPIFYILNVVLMVFIASALQAPKVSTPSQTIVPTDLLAYSKFEDPNSIRTVFVAVIVTSIASFCYVMMARSLRIKPRLARLLSASLIYSLAVQVTLMFIWAICMYSVGMLFPSIEYDSTIRVIIVSLAILLSLSLFIWALGSSMLVRASAWNKIHGMRRLIIHGAITSVFIVILAGLLMLSNQISKRALIVPAVQTVDIVDGECKLEKDGLRIRSVARNSSTHLYKIEAISVSVTRGEKNNKYTISLVGGPIYLAAETTNTIVGVAPNDKFLEEILTERQNSSDEAWECSYELNLSLPTGNFKKDKLQFPSLN